MWTKIAPILFTIILSSVYGEDGTTDIVLILEESALKNVNIIDHPYQVK